MDNNFIGWGAKSGFVFSNKIHFGSSWLSPLWNAVTHLWYIISIHVVHHRALEIYPYLKRPHHEQLILVAWETPRFKPDFWLSLISAISLFFYFKFGFFSFHRVIPMSAEGGANERKVRWWRQRWYIIIYHLYTFIVEYWKYIPI